MFKNIMSNTAGFGRKSVASVLAAFNRTIDELNEVERQNEAEAVRQAQIVEEANAARVAAIKKASLARDVAAKLSGLVAPVAGDGITKMGA